MADTPSGQDLQVRANTSYVLPETAGEVKTLSDKFQVGPEFVAKNLDYYRQLGTRFNDAQDYGRFAMTSPRAAQWVVDETHLAAAKNDLSDLERLEQFRAKYTALPELGFATAAGHALKRAAISSLEIPIGFGAALDYGAGRLTGGTPEQLASQDNKNWWITTAIDLEMSKRAVTASERGYGKTLGQEALGTGIESAADIISTGGGIGGGVAGAAKAGAKALLVEGATEATVAAAKRAGALTGASIGAGSASAIRSFESNLSQKQQETGDTSIDAKLISQALIDGAITAVSTRLGGLTAELRFTTKSARASKASELLKDFIIDTAAEGGEEGAQQIVDNLYNGRPLFQDVGKSAFIGALASAPLHLLNVPSVFAKESIENVVVPAHQAATAIHDSSSLADIVAHAENSPVYEKMKSAPESSRISYHEIALKQSHLEEVSFDKKAWNEYWAKVPGLDGQQVAAQLDAQVSYLDDSVPVVRVNTAKLLAKIVDTPHKDFVVENAISDRAGIALKQAVEIAQGLPDVLKENERRLEELKSKPVLSDGTIDDSKDIQDAIEKEFIAAEKGTGTGAKTRAKVNARTTALVYRSFAESLNKTNTVKITPKQLFDKMPVKATRLKDETTAEGAAKKLGKDGKHLRQDIRGVSVGNLIATLKSADASTMDHELAHWYLKLWSQLAAEGGLDQNKKDDLNAVKEWFKQNFHQGLQEDKDAVRKAAAAAGMETQAFYEREINKFGTNESPQDDVFRVAHELFAEGHTTWRKTGKAPTQELRSMFRQFAQWLMNIVGAGVQISEDMHKIYGRMLLIEDDIKREQERIGGLPKAIAAEKPPGMPVSVFNSLLRKTEEARAKATELARDRLGDLEAQLTAEDAHEREEAAKAKAELEVAGRKAYRAIAAIKGEQLHPEVPIVTSQKILFASLPQGTEQDRINAEMLKLKGLTSEDPSAGHVKDVATQNGYSTPEELIDDLEGAAPFNQAVQDQAEEYLLEDMGAIHQTDESSQKEIEEVNAAMAEAELAVILAYRRQGTKGKGLTEVEKKSEAVAKVKEKANALIEKAKTKGDEAVAEAEQKLKDKVKDLSERFKAKEADAKIFQTKGVADIKALADTEVSDDIIAYRLSKEEGSSSSFTDKATRLAESSAVKAAKNDYAGAANDLFQSLIYGKMAKAKIKDQARKTVLEKNWLEAELNHEMDKIKALNKEDRAKLQHRIKELGVEARWTEARTKREKDWLEAELNHEMDKLESELKGEIKKLKSVNAMKASEAAALAKAVSSSLKHRIRELEAQSRWGSARAKREKDWLAAQLNHEIDKQAKESKLERKQIVEVFSEQLRAASKTSDNQMIKDAAEAFERLVEKSDVGLTLAEAEAMRLALKVKAELRVGQMAVADITPRAVAQHKTLARRSADRRRRLERTGDLYRENGENALTEIQLQLWNMYVAQEMEYARRQIVKDTKYLKSVTTTEKLNELGKGGPWTVVAPNGTTQRFAGIDGEAKAKEAFEASGGDKNGFRMYRSNAMREQVEGLLYRYGLIKPSQMSSLMHLQMRGQTPAEDINTLSADDYSAIVNHVRLLQDAAKEQAELTQQGRSVSVEKAGDEARAQLKTTKAKKYNDRTAAWWEKAEYKFGQFLLSAQRLTTMIRGLDGGKSDGVFAKYLYHPYKRAKSHYDRIVNKALEAIESAKGVDFNRHVNEKIDVAGVGKMLRKDIYTVIMHTGNAEGMERLLVKDVKDKEGNVTGQAGLFTKKQLEAIEATLTERDVDFLNKFWAMHDNVLRPEISDAKSREGVKDIKWREAVPRTTKSGLVLNGGYSRLVYTSTPVNLYSLEQFGEYVDPGAKRPSDSYTREVAEKVDPALVLDLNFERQMASIEQVARDVAFREYAVNSSKFIKEVSHDLNSKFGDKTAADLTNMISHVVLGNPGATNGYEQAIGTIRRNISAFRMMGYLWVAAQQFTGLANATAHKDVNTRVLFSTLGEMVTDGKAMYNFMIQASDEMKSRLKEYNFEYHEAMLAFSNRSAKVKKAGDILSSPVRFMQGMVDTAVWHTAFKEGSKRYPTDQRAAIEFANRVVNETQGSGEVADVPVAFRSQMARALTLFASYKMTQLNQLISAYRDLRTEGDMKALWNAAHATSMVMITPAIMSYLMATVLRGADFGPSDDDTEDHPWLRWMTRQAAYEFGGLLPIVGMVGAPAIQNQSLASGVAAFSPVVELGTGVGKLLKKDPEFDAKNFYNAVPTFFFFPAGGQLGRQMEWTNAYIDGKIEGGQLTLGFLFGGSLKDAKKNANK